MSLASGGRVRTTVGTASNNMSKSRSTNNKQLSPFSVTVTSQNGYVYIGPDAYLLKQYNTPLPIHLGQALVPDGSSVYVALRDAVQDLKSEMQQTVSTDSVEIGEEYRLSVVNGELTVLRNGEQVMSVG